MRLYLRVAGGDWFSGFAVVDIGAEYLNTLRRRLQRIQQMHEQDSEAYRHVYWDGSPDIFEGDPFEGQAPQAQAELQMNCVDAYGGVYWKWVIKHTNRDLYTEILKLPQIEEALADGGFWVSPELQDLWLEDGISEATPTMEKH